MEKVIAGLDLGTSKIKVAVGKIYRDGKMQLLGLYDAPSHGISKGNIIDLTEASSAVEDIMAQVQQIHDSKIFKIVVAVSGVGFSFDRTKASVVLQDSPRELTKHDLQRALQSARNMSISLDRFMLYETVEDYILDGQHGIKNPEGLFAKKLEVKLYSLFHNMSHIQNVIRCISYAGYEVEKITFSGVAGISCLVSKEELKEGVVFVDIGDGTTKIVIATEERIKFCNLLDVGGSDITNAISSKLRISIASAEQLKLDSSVIKDYSTDEEIHIMVGNREKTFLQSEINNIVKKKTDELLKKIKDQLDSSALMDSVRLGIILTGGGALLDGLPERMEGVFNLPVRIGEVKGASTSLDKPSHLFASSIGALGFYAKEMKEKRNKVVSNILISKLTHKITTFINDYF